MTAQVMPVTGPCQHAGCARSCCASSITGKARRSAWTISRPPRRPRPGPAWNDTLALRLRGGLKDAREQLKREAVAVRATFNAVRSRAELERVADQVALLRKRYLQTELLVDFYVAAVRARANPEVGLQLRACDVMADRTVRGALEQLGMKAPPIMTYFTTGVGASILRIGTRLLGRFAQSHRRDSADISQSLSHHFSVS